MSEVLSFDEKVGRVLAAHIDGCSGLISCDRLSAGASQETYRLVARIKGEDVPLAFRRGAAASLSAGDGPGLVVEALLFDVAREAGVPEPEVYYVLQEADDLGEGFIMEWLEGETLGARIARSPEFEALRPELAFACGEALARIHGVDLEATGLMSKLKTVSPKDYVLQTWESYKALESPQPMLDYTAQWLLQNLPEGEELGLVHSDFRNGNFMVRSGEGIIAVLDWEAAHIGDPIRDLGWICTNSWRFGVADLPVGGFGTREDLLAGYEAVSGRKVSPEHLKFWEIFGSFWWGCTSLGMGATYRLGLDKSVERPGIGRRTSECQVDCVNLLIPGPVKKPVPQVRGLSVDLPRTDELLASVRDFLRNEVMNETSGRVNFLSRVASNSLDIVLREVELGDEHQAYQKEALKDLLGKSGEILDLQWDLTHALRHGLMALDNGKLKAYLRQSVVTQVAIDQPKYSGYQIAIGEQQETNKNGEEKR